MRLSVVPLLAAVALLRLPYAAGDDGGTGRRQYVVAAIGDSLTDYKSHGGKYLRLLADHCPASRFDSYGKGAQMVNQMRVRFARDVLGEPPDPAQPKPAYTDVIVLGGVNDVVSDESANRTPDKITADLAAMYRAARSKGMRVIAATIAPWGGFKRYFNAKRAAETDQVNLWIRGQVAARTVDHVIDSEQVLSCGDRQRLCAPYTLRDGIHWSSEGHVAFGERLWKTAFRDCR